MSKALSTSNLVKIIDIFDLARAIAEKYLEIQATSHGIQEHEDAILNRLKAYYIELNCKPDKDNTPERMFILQSLPLISSIIQIGSTIQNFNKAMIQIEEIYDLKDSLEKASRLSLLIFAYAIDEGRIRFFRDKDEALWLEIQEQVKNLLEAPQSRLWPIKNCSEQFQRSIEDSLMHLAKRCSKKDKKDLAEDYLKKSLMLNEKSTMVFFNKNKNNFSGIQIENMLRRIQSLPKGA